MIKLPFVCLDKEHKETVDTPIIQLSCYQRPLHARCSTYAHAFKKACNLIKDACKIRLARTTFWFNYALNLKQNDV